MPSKKVSRAPVENSYQAPMYGGGNNVNLLTLPLIALSFFCGYLFFKVQNLEKANTGAPTAAAGTQPQQAPEPTPDLGKMPAVTNSDHVLGSLDAPVVMVEYSDYQCPFCQRFHPTMEQVVKEYGPKVAWVLRQYPLPFHPYAQKAAEVSECVAKLGGNDKFWKFSNEVYAKASNGNDTYLAVDNLIKVAGTFGVNTAQMKTCVDSGEMAATITAQQNGGSAAGINGTPGTVVISKSGRKELIPGALPYDQVKTYIENALK